MAPGGSVTAPPPSWQAFEAEALPAWLVTILQHLRSNRRRAAHRYREVEDVDDQIAETVPFVPAIPQHLTDDDLLAALRGIPEPYQDIILLADVEETFSIATLVSVVVAADAGATASWIPWQRLDHDPAALAPVGDQQVASFRGSAHTVFVVSSLSDDDVQAVAQVMAGPVLRALAGA